jgi:hypothetical protein
MTDFFKKYGPLFLLLILFGSFYLTEFSLVTLDLGRHLTNGKEIVAGFNTGDQSKVWAVLNTNYYSQTQGDFPFTNHHWLFGVLAYFAQSAIGLTGLSIINMLMNLFAFLIVILLASKKSSLKIAILVAFLLMPLITRRSDIRPESLSFLFLAVYIWLFDYFNAKKFLILSFVKRFLLILPILIMQIIWVNSHLFWSFGILVAGLYFLENVFSLAVENSRDAKNRAKFFGILLFALVGVSLVNPFGIQGLLYPLSIFNNYSYPVAENQSTVFMLKFGYQVEYYWYLVAITIGGLFIIAKSEFGSLINNRGKKLFALKILSLILLIVTHKVNRVSPFLALSLIPVLAMGIKNWRWNNFIDFKIDNELKNTLKISLTTIIIFGAVAYFGNNNWLFANPKHLNPNIIPSSNASVEFFKDNNLQGPIFNNYDIGSYLIYHLYPEEKVFVDNRPEAYSSEFLADTHIRAQQNEDSWQELLEQQQFKVIYFYKHDATDWAYGFLSRRLEDPEWKLVYSDDWVVIFEKI